MNELMEQGTPEWLAARCGKVTASKICDIMPTKTGKTSATYETYFYTKLAERLTGTLSTAFVTAAMQWGLDHENEAADYYAILSPERVDSCGIYDHHAIPMAAASPDRLVGATGLLEIKCPSTIKHLRTFETREIDQDYIFQMQWQMACTGRDWCDFVSFDPRLPNDWCYVGIRVKRDNELINKLEAAVIEFNNKLEAILQKGIK